MQQQIVVTRTRQPGGRGASGVVGSSVLVLLVLWFSIISAIALVGGFDAAVGERPLGILLAIAVPILVYAMSWYALPAFRQWLLELDMRRLVLLHSWRMLGLGFVFLMFQQRLPAVFALPAGLGDALAAVGAVVLGIAMYESLPSVSKRRIVLWNSLGLLDFVVAVSVGVMSRPGELLHFSGEVGSEIMGSFPLALIPAFAVPFYIITHLVIFAQLRRPRTDLR